MKAVGRKAIELKGARDMTISNKIKCCTCERKLKGAYPYRYAFYAAIISHGIVILGILTVFFLSPLEEGRYVYEELIPLFVWLAIWLVKGLLEL